MKKWTCFIMALIMACGVGCMTGCGSEDDGADGDGPNGLSSRLTLEVYEAGFGTEWLNDIAKNYQAATGVKVKVNVSYLETEIPSKLSNNQSTADIVFMVGSAFDAQSKNMLVDLSDVLASTPSGESKTIRQKMSGNIYNYLADDDGKIYQLPWANTVSSLCYNETTLNEVLGAGTWKVPNTTDEFFTLADRIKAANRGCYTFVDSTKTGYGNYLFTTWWAQYDGTDCFYDYFDGYYYPGGVRTFAQNGEIYDNVSRLRSLEVCERLFKRTNGYTHAKSDRMEFNESQIVFAGQGYGTDKSKAAFIVSGDWLENELISYLQAAEAAGNPQTIKMMKMPVISSIVETLNSVSGDAELSALITAIDNGETALTGTGYEVTQADFDRVAEARNTVYSLTYNHPFGIPSNSKRPATAKDFIKYMLSEYGQSIYAKNLNGLTMPFGYQADVSTLSTFVKSRLDCYDYSYMPVGNDYSSERFRLGRIGLLKTDSAYVDGDLFSGITAQTIFNNTSTFYKNDWRVD